MTPAKNIPAKILGGVATFLGAMPEIDVVIMSRREIDGLPQNNHSLPKPFASTQVLTGATTAAYGWTVLFR